MSGDSEQRKSRWPVRGRALFAKFVTLRWVPLTAALLSLPLSAAAILISLQQPEVLVILPDQVRIAQGRGSGAAYAYLQPAFVSTGRNERIEVIRDMDLEVAGPGQPAVFRWTQQLRLVGGTDGDGLSYEYVADAVPLLVSPRNAAAPLSLFEAPQSWFFSPGDYTFRLVADRVITGEPLTAEFRLTLSADDVALLDQPGPDRFLTFPIE
ncbi:MAG: hypothetical protein ABI797_03235 [Chloroflexota bacterium]